MLFAASDITLDHLKYLADHLSLDECRHFVASLLSPSYEVPSNIANEVVRLDPDDTCLELLEKWNSGDGKSASHSILATRLIQTGHSDLSLWLSSTVFQQFTQQLEAAVEGREDSKDSELEENTERIPGSISIIKKAQAANAIRDRIIHEEDDDDDISPGEFAASLILIAIMAAGYLKLHRFFCKSTPNSK